MAILAVFGASGRTGGRVCAHAQAAGYTLRVLARDPSRLTTVLASASRGAPSDAGVGGPRGSVAPPQVIIGDVLNTAAVDALVGGADAIISALGSDDFRSPGNTLSQGMLNIVAAAQTHGVRRVLAVAGSGVLDAPGGGLRLDQASFPEIFRAITTQHLGTWFALRDSGLDWTIACTPDLTDDPRTGTVRAATNVMPVDGTRIPCDDLAYWLVDQIDRSEFIGTRVGLAI